VETRWFSGMVRNLRGLGRLFLWRVHFGV